MRRARDKQPKGRDSDTIRIIFDKNGNGVDNKLSIYIFYFLKIKIMYYQRQ
ncbi:Hypothetical protein ETEE_0064 [Edwardsiella anguillarum ET080813]|uniref:Uncharacterized protein n=1 Tax=Edwardsiella anguillarum ET080813 TaxID=667120 RepID=A0A076LDI2_9GAMM|nr:Hypothetical protein ETEE_0064 [Edwardsiella anguillarum ET080813]